MSQESYNKREADEEIARIYGLLLAQKLITQQDLEEVTNAFDQAIWELGNEGEDQPEIKKVVEKTLDILKKRNKRREVKSA